MEICQCTDDVQGGDGEASRHLLADYSVTPSATPILRTPRTPANEDTILKEAQTILALQNVQTPLKGIKIRGGSGLFSECKTSS